MKRVARLYLRVLGAAVGTFHLTAPPSAAAQTGNADRVAQGAEVYGAMCGRCHNARSPLERTDGQWTIIANHMRVRANLTGRQMRDVLAFLQATNSSPSEPAPIVVPLVIPEPIAPPGGPVSTDPAVIAQGDTLVRKNACIGCHVIGPGGGPVGPSLNGVIARRGPDFVRRKLAEPTFNNAASMMPNFGLSGQQIEAIAAYLNTLRR